MLEANSYNLDPLEGLDDRRVGHYVVQTFEKKVGQLSPHEKNRVKDVCSITANDHLIAWMQGGIVEKLEALLGDIQALRRGEVVALDESDIIEVIDDGGAACNKAAN